MHISADSLSLSELSFCNMQQLISSQNFASDYTRIHFCRVTHFRFWRILWQLLHISYVIFSSTNTSQFSFRLIFARKRCCLSFSFSAVNKTCFRSVSQLQRNSRPSMRKPHFRCATLNFCQFCCCFSASGVFSVRAVSMLFSQNYCVTIGWKSLFWWDLLWDDGIICTKMRLRSMLFSQFSLFFDVSVLFVNCIAINLWVWL